MRSLVWPSLRILTACFFVALFAFPPQGLTAQNHLVSPSDLQKATISAAQMRHNLEQVNQFFATPLAQKALKDAHISSALVKTAISSLSDEELAKIAGRAEKA
jgi:hypothetical protein